jgi:hypothetical protein
LTSFEAIFIFEATEEVVKTLPSLPSLTNELVQILETISNNVFHAFYFVLRFASILVSISSTFFARIFRMNFWRQAKRN